MKENGLARDTLENIIKILDERLDTWNNDNNRLNYADIRDASWYLHEYSYILTKPRSERLMDVLREVRGEK